MWKIIKEITSFFVRKLCIAELKKLFANSALDDFNFNCSDYSLLGVHEWHTNMIQMQEHTEGFGRLKTVVMW